MSDFFEKNVFFGTRFSEDFVLLAEEYKSTEVMKTRISYLLLVFMCFTLVLPAQTKDRISIELKGETLPTALKKLEQVSGYRILFTYSDVQ